MTGNAASPATLTISETDPYDFGQVADGGTAQHTFIVQNIGGVNATTLSGALPNADYDFAGGTFPGTGAVCPLPIVPLGTCEVIVDFNPTAVAAINDTLTVNYNNGVIPQSVDRNIIGEGVSPAVLTITDAGGFDFTQVANGSLNDHTFTVSNSGAVPATLFNEDAPLTAPFEYRGGGGFPGAGGTCGPLVSVGSSCTLVVSYNPTGPLAVHNDVLELTYFDGVSTLDIDVNITGESVAPGNIIVQEGLTHNFNDIAVGGIAETTFTLENDGDVDVTSMNGLGIDPPYRFTDGSCPGNGGDCGLVLAPTATYTIVVTFEPPSVNNFLDTVNINYNDGAAPQTTSIALSGDGADPAVLTIAEIEPFDYNPQTVDSVTPHIFVVSNTGDVEATGLAITSLVAPFNFAGGAFPGTGSATPCTSTLAAGATCDLVVEYSPVTTGLHLNSIDLAYNDGVTAQVEVQTLRGTGLSRACLLYTSPSPRDQRGSRMPSSA